MSDDENIFNSAESLVDVFTDKESKNSKKTVFRDREDINKADQNFPTPSKMNVDRALLKQARYLREFEEILRKRQIKELETKLTNLQKEYINDKIKEKKKQKERPPGCQHKDVYASIEGSLVVSKCRICSRLKYWSISEWSYYTTQTSPIKDLVNPQPDMFSF